MTTHNPTPWTNGVTKARWRSRDAAGNVVASTELPYDVTGDECPNADFIVCAINAHDAREEVGTRAETQRCRSDDHSGWNTHIRYHANALGQ